MEQAFFARPPATVASDLIGCGLFVAGVGGLIVETEAYDRTDPASHAFNGETRRNKSMFGPPGHAYVYRSYGLHWCLNLVCESGGAVLLRALEPTEGLAVMADRRGLSDRRLLCAGPGRLCQALAVAAAHDGLPLDGAPFDLRPRATHVDIVTATRIGLTCGRDTPWRFLLARSPYVSRPVPGARAPAARAGAP